MNINKFRALIVDDEPLARKGIRRLLEAENDFIVAGEAANGEEAISAIEREKADVVFLDIQMPLLDGLALTDEIDPEFLPEIVFVTAYDEHAIQAFEAGAIDYVLKPIDPARFRKTLDRVRRRIVAGGNELIENRIVRLLSGLPTRGEQYLQRIAIRQGERIRFLGIDEVEWILSQGNYIELHSGGKKFLLRETMSGIEKKLDPRQFLRIRRSTVIRVDHIKEIQPMFNGEFTVLMRDGTELATSRRYRKRLESLLKP